MKKFVLGITITLFCVTGVFAQLRQKKQFAAANTVLTKIGKFAEDSFYSCLLNSYNQGLSPAQARNECATKLLEDDKKGFGGSLENLRPGSEKFFDPSQITAACNSGDPTRGQTSGSNTIPGRGTYTWGRGSYTKDDRGTGVGKGLSESESRAIKEANVREAEKAEQEYADVILKLVEANVELKKAEASGDPSKIKAAKEAVAKVETDFKAAAKKAETTNKEANRDPNLGGISRSAGEPSACDLAVEGARELLRECHRTQWKDFRCQQLQANMNGCPDPALILVDPDQGYSCGAKVDPEAVKNAWVAKCEQRVKVVPDTANPCSPPTFDSFGRFGKGKMSDICGNPYAQTDPDNDECSNVTIGKQFGEINIQEVIVVGLNKLGGPIFVIPKNPKPPRPGADPRPGPRPK